MPGQPLAWGNGNGTNGWATATPGGWATPTGAQVLSTETRVWSQGGAKETVVGVRYVCKEEGCPEEFTGAAVGRVVELQMAVAVAVGIGGLLMV